MKLNDEIKARVTKETKATLTLMAAREGVEISDLLRRAVSEFLKHHTTTIWAGPSIEQSA